LKDLDGNTHKLSDYRGNVVILDFWATYCPPCKKEIPDFIDLVDEYGERGLVILGIVLDGEAKARKFIKNDLEGKEMNYPILLSDGQVVGDFGGVKFIPTTFIITPSGGIAQKFIGFRDKATFLSAVKPYLTGE
jgi:cytochrome c biogenesis protein CcmG/thiol:disulfide interchange protein DsbE